MSDARARILDRLLQAPRHAAPVRPDWQPATYATAAERTDRFQAMLEAVHGEVHRVTAAGWPETLRAILAERGVRTLLYGATEAGSMLAAAWTGTEAPTLLPYDRSVEEFRAQLVQDIDAGFTTTLGGIAETGTLVLWPTAAEPRLMSLLPPIHVALVEASKLTDSLAGLLAEAGWSKGMPTNALLISGPSKTADIEQTLAYGVHGPKEVIVLLVVD
jgi:L-lactate dehydrogenase complex protein LldG